MATALVQLDADGTKYVAVYLEDGDAAYRSGSSLQNQNGKAVAYSKSKGTDWQDWCQELAQRTPTNIWWEAKDAPDDSTAEQVLAELVAKQFSD